MGVFSAPDDIPIDLVMEILIRLAPKSLMRFKCVSKLMASLITSQYLSSKRFLSVPSPRLYMSLSDEKEHIASVTLSLSLNNSDTTSPPCSFVVDHDLTVPRVRGSNVSNIGGFMCYTFKRALQIYNPATRQLVTLPALPHIRADLPSQGRIFRNVFSFCLAHDPVYNEYKVICSIGRAVNIPHQPTQLRTEHWIFALQTGGGSWKKADPPPNSPDYRPHFPRRGSSINCVTYMYYLARTGEHELAVVRFNLITDEFKVISVPRMDRDEEPGRWHNVCLVKYGGKATFLDKTCLRDKGTVDLWVLEHAGNQEWSRKTLFLKPCQLHLVNNDILFKVHGTTQNGKVLLIPRDLVSPFHVLCYDMQANDMRKIDVNGIPEQWFSHDKANDICFELMFMDHSESVMYLETKTRKMIKSRKRSKIFYEERN